MNGQMSINTEVVGAAVNQISVDIADIETRIKRFHALLLDKNQQTQGKFAIVKRLTTNIEIEVQNVASLNTASEEIRGALQKYIELAEMANDDSAFRID